MAYFLRLTTGPESVRYRRVPSVWVLELVSNEGFVRERHVLKVKEGRPSAVHLLPRALPQVLTLARGG